MNNFYVYEHWRPDKDQPFYVGKGRGRRAWSSKPRNPHYKAVVDKLSTIGLCVEVRMVVGEMTSEQAYAAEIERILFWKIAGVRLTNMTGGGEGASEFSPEMRALIAEKQRGKKRSAETRKKIADGARKISAEGRAKRSASLTGIVRSSETREKISASKINPSLETRQRNKIAAQQNWRCPELRARQIAARVGMIRITDGAENRTVRSVSEIPAGWRRGLTKKPRLVGITEGD